MYQLAPPAKDSKSRCISSRLSVRECGKYVQKCDIAFPK